MKIAFHSNQLCERGTEVAMYDYAKYNEEILGNESIIISNYNKDLKAFSKFKERFTEVWGYIDFSLVEKMIKKEKVDIFYAIKRGRKDGIGIMCCKTVIHCVFEITEPHGDVYAAVGDQLSQGKVPVVPHMVDIPFHNKNMRRKLKIPKDAVVFGRHGGIGDFNIDFVKDEIKNILSKRKDVYFLFLNTREFFNHDRIIYLPFILDLSEKVKFINTCDAMIHAKHRGETFGLTVGEFSVRNKPVITWGGSREIEHLNLLGEKAIVYSNASQLYKIFMDFDRNWSSKQNWDVYSKKYNSNKVMEIFKRVFIDE